MVAVKVGLWLHFLQNGSQDGITPHLRDVSWSPRQIDEEKNHLSAIGVQKAVSRCGLGLVWGLWFFNFFIARLSSDSVKVCWNVDMGTM